MRRSRTRTSRICPETSVSAVTRGAPFPVRLVAGLSRTWLAVRWLWAALLVLAVAALAATTLVIGTATDRGASTPSTPSTAPTWYPTYPWYPSWMPPRVSPAAVYDAAAACWALAILSLCAFAAYRLELAARRRTLAPFVLKPVRRLDPTMFVPRYVDGVYLYRNDAVTQRSADDAARAALYTAGAHRRGRHQRWTLGICVYGRPTQGKTRLAWEALRATLPGWTFVRWRHTLEPLDVSALRGKRVALWLDDLHEYANQNEAVALNDLPARLEAVGARLVVVATCRDGEDETRACKYLESLVERLTPVRLTNIREDEADQLVAALTKCGVAVPRENFSQTPGSLLLDVRGMRSTRYPALSEDAKQVLRALKLLRSARIFSYPVERVRATAVDVFGLPPAAWPAARDEAIAAGFVRRETVRCPSGGERLLVPVASAYLETVVPDYLTPNAETGDDWPWLQESLERHRDGEALLSLGNAYADQRPGVGPFLPSDPATTRLQSAMCFRAALDVFTRGAAPYCWAVTQANLAAALSRLAELAQGIQRTDLQRQSSAAYRAALEIFTRETDPGSWALTHYSLADLFHRRAADAVYLGETADACGYLRQAWRYAECALTVYTREDDPAHFRQVAKLRASILAAMCELDCAGDDAGEE